MVMRCLPAITIEECIGLVWICEVCESFVINFAEPRAVKFSILGILNVDRSDLISRAALLCIVV